MLLDKKRILVIANDTSSLYRFRLDMIRAFLNSGYDVYAIGPDDKYQEYLETQGIRYRQIPYKRTGINPLSDIKLMREYYRAVKEIAPSKVFTYNLKPVLYGNLASKKANIKDIYSMIPGAGFVFSVENRKAYLIKIFVRALYKKSLECAEKVFFQNPDDMREFLQADFVSQRQCVQVNGSGVNMQAYPFECLPDQVTFIFIARLLQVKGIMEYCQAARNVRNRYPQAVFHVVGGIDDNPTSIDIASLDEYIRNGDILYHGYVEDVRPLLRKASVYVLPSYHREGVPHAALEALSMGRPIITTDEIGCRETVIDGVNGFLVQARDSNALSEKMEWFIENKQKLQQMGNKSRELCKIKFDVNLNNKIICENMRL